MKMEKNKGDIITVTVHMEVSEETTIDSIDLTDSDEDDADFTVEIGPKNVLVQENDDIILKCSTCDTVFLHVLPFIRHIVQHEVAERIQQHEDLMCDSCGLLLANTQEFQVHNCKYDTDATSRKDDKHSLLIKQKCFLCGTHFRHVTSLKKHLGNLHNVIFFCFICKKVFATNDKLEGHLKMNFECLKPYVCNICGMRFKFALFLARHRRGELNGRACI